MTSTDQTGSTALVTGASRGFGRAIASVLHAEGANVVAVARNADLLASLDDELGGTLTTVVADVTDPVVAGSLIERYRPDTLVLNAGAAPLGRPLHQHTWETFSRNWDVDVRHAFHWIREALLLPLEPGSTVITISSGAAVAGLTAQRRLRRGQGHDPVHHQLRRRRVGTGGPWHPVHLDPAQVDTGDRPRGGGGSRLRAARWHRRRPIPPALRPRPHA